MKRYILLVLSSCMLIAGCASTPKSTEPSAKPSDATTVATTTKAKKGSIYEGIHTDKVTQCMGKPVATFAANGHEYWRYFTPSRCEVLFIVDGDAGTVVGMKYIFPHAFTRYGYAVSEKQCPLTQKTCLLS